MFNLLQFIEHCVLTRWDKVIKAVPWVQSWPLIHSPTHSEIELVYTSAPVLNIKYLLIGSECVAQWSSLTLKLVAPR